VSVDWNHLPPGLATGAVTISGPGTSPIDVRLKAFKPSLAIGTMEGEFLESDGYVAIEANHYSTRHDTANAHWESLPDYGRNASAMTVFPVTAPQADPPRDSACLGYAVQLFTPGKMQVALELSPSLNYSPDRGVRIGVSFDDDVPQLLTVVPKGYVAGDGNRDWEQTVKDSVRVVRAEHTLQTPGSHALKVWMVDPGVVLQRVLIDAGGVRPSYLGPPESLRAEKRPVPR